MESYFLPTRRLASSHILYDKRSDNLDTFNTVLSLIN
jgi:hypothetical protein